MATDILIKTFKMDAHPRRLREEIFIANGIHFIIYSDSSSDDELNRNINVELIYQENLNKNRGLSQDELLKIEEMVWKEEYRLEDSKPESLVLVKKQHDCAICLTIIQKGDSLRKLHCGHIFHKNCLDGWLKLKGICPIDRKKV
jgi:Ring finger domain